MTICQIGKIFIFVGVWGGHEKLCCLVGKEVGSSDVMLYSLFSRWRRDLVELCSGPIPRKFNYDHYVYKLQIIIRRDASSIMWNQALSLFIIDVLSLVAYGIDPLDLADRSSIVFTMLLTGMAFKFVLSDKLPSVPYLTTFDRFVRALKTVVF